ncbi:MAG TPA: tetratricopeptide repeat protein, partial [Anaerolineaceae bacterium]|nr:tetratricopeptide repeat protein [Anaerolineaceae bacterium]
MNQGHSAAWDQQWDQAARYYRLALQACPDHPSALTSLGLALYELSDFSHALQTYQRAAQVEPTDPVPVEKMSQIYERQGQIRKAVLTGMQAAELHLKARDVEKSISGWIRVLTLDPENQTARTRLALIYEKLGRHKEAIHEYVGVASLMQRANEPEKGYQVLRHCQQLVPGNIEAQQALSALKTGQVLPKPGRPRGGNAPTAPHAAELPPAQPVSEALNPVTA